MAAAEVRKNLHLSLSRAYLFIFFMLLHIWWHDFHVARVRCVRVVFHQLPSATFAVIYYSEQFWQSGGIRIKKNVVNLSFAVKLHRV